MTAPVERPTVPAMASVNEQAYAQDIANGMTICSPEVKRDTQRRIKAVAARGGTMSESDKFVIVTPQFERPKSDAMPASPPADRAAFESLRSLDKNALRELGLRPWGRRERQDGSEYGPMLWLFPHEWFGSIPYGYEVVDISFRSEPFDLATADDDIRFGCLPYGIEVAIEQVPS